MKLFLTYLTLLAAANISRAALFTNSVSVDAFVRADAPTANYGAAGALTVSGTTATNASGTVNGIADTFIRFNTAALVTSLDSTFGQNHWIINGVSLRVVETGAPNNNIFTRGKGAFEIRWTSNDSWTEGTGMPMTPTTDGIAYNDEPPLLTNTVSLGTFTNAAANTIDLFSLALPNALASDISAGGDVSLYLTAVDTGIGFTFNSENITTANQRPVLIISAASLPDTIAVTLSDTGIVIWGTNNVARSATNIVLSSTNAIAPINQWTAIATNIMLGPGSFSVPVATPNHAGASPQQFFILQTQ